MVNYYANSTEVLGDNYSIISLECDEYNPNIDGTVTLTVTAKSVYGNPIEDMEIPVTASDGNFTELNGSSITGASTVTGTTDSNGEFTLTYSCSEWGLITFSANNTSKQVHVTGWREITAGTGRLWVNDETKTAVYHFTRTGTITSELSFANAIPSGYGPKSNVRMIGHNAAAGPIKIIVESSGTVKVNGTSSSSITVAAQITYGYDIP